MSVLASSLKLYGIVRGSMDDNCVLEFLNHTIPNCSMNHETAVTMHCGHFNQVFFAVLRVCKIVYWRSGNARNSVFKAGVE